MRIHFEKVVAPDNSTIARLSYYGRYFDCPYHAHPETEVLLITSSHGKFLAGDHLGVFRPGDLFLLGSGLPHTFTNDRGVGARQKAGSEYIQFLSQALGDRFWALSEMARVKALLDRASGGLHFPAGQNASLAGLFKAAHRAEGGLAVSGLIVLLEAMAENGGVRLSHRSGGWPGHRDEARIGRVLDHVHEAFGGPISLAGAAKLAGLSPSAFSRFFRRHTGLTFRAYVIALRLSSVRRRLLETDCTVAEAAFASGFNNLANFNRCFRKDSGQTPRTFLKEAKATAAA